MNGSERGRGKKRARTDESGNAEAVRPGVKLCDPALRKLISK